MDAVVQLNSALTERYAVDREIGRGGMATVYLARDVRHDRKVALKVLNPELGAVLGAERFLSEIKVTANLQHPNLLPLFDSGEADGLLFYVMPYVEGESLRARIEREKQLPIDEALRITTAVAGALDYAHRQGVIHRDLKPENILVHAGQPVIADFGIALAVSNAGGARITQTGLSLGTPQYMSPEQAMGDRSIDGRTDIYSLGAIAYEMLTGEPPHVGTTGQAIIARVLTEAPRSPRVTRPNVPEHVDAAVMRALEKLPADRFMNAAGFADALQQPGATQARPTARRTGSRGTVTDWRVWAVVAITALAWGIVEWRRVAASDAQRRVVRAALDLPLAATTLALSRDGRRIVYVGKPVGDSSAPARLYVRDLDKLAPTEIPGTVGAVSPLLSPDGESVFYLSGRSLRRVAVAGGIPTTVVDTADAVPVEFGESEGGSILLNGFSRILEVEAGGGLPVTIYEAPGQQVASAVRLPGTSEFLFVGCPHQGWCTDEERELFAITRGARVPRVVSGFRGIHRVRCLGGYLVYQTADNRLRLVKFDAHSLTMIGQPAIVGEQASFFALSERGDLVTVWQPPAESEFVVWEPSGVTRSLPGPHRNYVSPVVSPDGRSIAVEAEGMGRLEVFDIERGTLRELTSTGHIGGVDWSPDGKRLVYSIYRNGVMRLEWLAIDGDLVPHAFGKGTPIKGLGGSGFLSPSWVPGSRRVVYHINNESGRHDIMMISIDSGDFETPVVRSQSNAVLPRVSPDGRWLGYVSNESGRDQLYVQRFPGDGARPGTRVIVSLDGIAGPFYWGRTAATLQYQATDGWVYTAHLDLGETPRVVSRERLLDARSYSGWAPFPDGRRILLVRRATATDPQRVTLTLDWTRELSSR